MRVLIQWTRDRAADWSTVDSADWGRSAVKAEPVGGETLDDIEGWIFGLCIQGVVFTGFDHYHVEDVDAETARVSAWNDDPDDWADQKHARVWTFRNLAADAAMGGAINTRQTQVRYAESGANMPGALPWADFTAPTRDVRHGIWTTDTTADEHDDARSQANWRSWIEGLDASELDENGLLKPQRSQGRYLVPDGTRTYFLNDTALASGVHVVDSESELGLMRQVGAANFFGINLGVNASALYALHTTVSGEPNEGQWPTGDYRASIDVAEAGSGLTFGYATAGTADGHFGRVNSGLTSDLETKVQTEGLASGTGIKLFTTGSVSWSSGAAGDRFEVLLACTRDGVGHGNESMDFLQGDVDSFADGPWNGVNPITGTATAAAAGSGDLNGTGELDGTATAQAAGSGDLNGVGELTGTATAQAVASGNAESAKSQITGTATAVAAGSGALQGTGALAGTAGVTAAGSGTLTGTGALSGTATAQAVATANLTDIGALIGTATATTAGAGALTGTGALSGTATAQAAASGAVVGTGELTGSAGAQAAGTGALTAVGELAGNADVAVAGSGELLATGALSGSAPVTVAGSGNLTPTAGPIEGTATAQAVGSGALTGIGELTGTATATAAASGAIQGTGALAGNTDATAAASGAIEAVGALAGSAGAQAAASGALDGAGQLSGSAPAVAIASGDLTIATSKITGTATAQAAASGALSGIGALAGMAPVTAATTGALTKAFTDVGKIRIVTFDIAFGVESFDVDPVNPNEPDPFR